MSLLSHPRAAYLCLYVKKKEKKAKRWTTPACAAER